MQNGKLIISIFNNGKCTNYKRNVSGNIRIKISKLLQNDRPLGKIMDACDGIIIRWLNARQEKLFLKNQRAITNVAQMLTNMGFTNLEITVLRWKSMGLHDGEIAGKMDVTVEQVLATLRNLYWRNAVNNFAELWNKLWG